MNVHEILEHNPLEVLRRSPGAAARHEAAGYVERLLSEPGGVALWNTLRSALGVLWNELLKRPSQEVEPLEAGQIEDILQNGVVVPVSEDRLKEDHLVRLLLSPKQLEELALRAQTKSEYFRSRRSPPQRPPVVFRARFTAPRGAAAKTAGPLASARGVAAPSAESDEERRKAVRPYLDPGRWCFEFEADPEAWGLEDLSLALGLPDPVYLVRFDLVDETTGEPVFDVLTVLFGAARGQRANATGVIEIEPLRWKDEFPRIEEASSYRISPVSLAEAKALAAKAPGAVARCERVNAARSPFVRRLLETLTLRPPSLGGASTLAMMYA